MAVTVEEIALDLRLIADAAATIDPGIEAVLSRHKAAAEIIVMRRASTAPEALRDQAVIAMAAYWYEAPASASNARYASAWRNSGASTILGPYVRWTARAIGDADGAASTRASTGGPGVDATARADAARALELAEHVEGLLDITNAELRLGDNPFEREIGSLADFTEAVERTRTGGDAFSPSILHFTVDLQVTQNGVTENALAGDRWYLDPGAHGALKLLSQAIDPTARSDLADLEQEAATLAQSIAANSQGLLDVGDVQSVTVSTAASYNATLDSQLGSAKPLILVTAAAIAGNRPVEHGSGAFNWPAGQAVWFPPASQDGEALFVIGQGTGRVDLSAYRTAADQDIIDGRATEGIRLARQEANAADEKAVAAQEGTPADIPDAPAAGAAQVDYVLRRPASGAASTETLWTPATAGLTPEQAAALAGVTVTDETAAREQADAALAARIDAATGYAAPVFDVVQSGTDHGAAWVKTGDARTVIVHLDPRADAIAGLAKIRLSVQGIVKTLARTANQDVYSFALTAADAANITRAAGNARSDTVRADVTLLDSSDGELQRWRGLLRVQDSAPSSGGSAPTYALLGTVSGDGRTAALFFADAQERLIIDKLKSSDPRLAFEFLFQASGGDAYRSHGVANLVSPFVDVDANTQIPIAATLSSFHTSGTNLLLSPVLFVKDSTTLAAIAVNDASGTRRALASGVTVNCYGAA